MHCQRCRGPMIVTEHLDQPRSVQTWYQCTDCSGQRLISVDKPRTLTIGRLPLSSTPRVVAPGETGI